MARIVKIGQVLQNYIDGRDWVDVEGATVRECLDNLIKKHPEAKEDIYDIHGNLLAIVLVNGEIVPPVKLDKKVSAFDKIDLVPLVIGG
jgi:molybdopterin converting factor small subunit